MRGLGYFLGATFGAALLFFIISYIFLSPRKVNDDEIDKFIKESDRILIKESIPFLNKYEGDDERLGAKTESKLTYFINKNMSYVRSKRYTYYSKEFKKYIKIITISEGAGMISELQDFGNENKDKTRWPDMYFYYNKTQNSDPTYGTIDKPLPTLHFRSSNPALRSMRQNNRDSDPAYLKEKYTENVKLYLEYFIEKEDFKKLFPDS